MLKNHRHNEKDVYVFDGYWTREDAAERPHLLFIIGDNEMRVGKGGQAIIRGLANVEGICTKRTPGMDNDAYWTDQNFEHHKIVVEADIARVNFKLAHSQQDIVLAAGGYGTGLAYLNRYAPRTFAYLSERLMEEYGFDNIAAQDLYK